MSHDADTAAIVELLTLLADGIQRQADYQLDDSHAQWIRDEYERSRPEYVGAARLLYEARRRIAGR